MSNADLENIEISIEQAKAAIHRNELLAVLQEQPAFKELIEKGFLSEHAVRQVLLKAHPALQDEKSQKLLDQNIIAIGSFKQYLIGIHTEGLNAAQALAEDEATREEILAEDLTNSCAGGFN